MRYQHQEEIISLRGRFRILFFYDVADAIRLDLVRSRPESTGAELSTKLPLVPQYLRFERPPVAEPIDPITLDTGDRFEGRIKYYDYGVVSIELDLPFEGDWDSTVRQSSHWSGAPELENRATELVRAALKRITAAIVRPFENWLREDYYIVQLGECLREDGRPLAASELLSLHGREIAQLVRGESLSLSLSDAERQEILQSSISYSQNDLLVVGWSGALVYGHSDSAMPAIQLLEYANTQLLEFRYYDGLLTNLLNDVYRLLEQKVGLLAAWRLSREAARVNTMRLDVMELTEKVDHAIKFLSDMFYARLYGIIAAKVGVPDYRQLVDQKLRTAGELYRFMVDQFNQSRSFILELAVVIILIIDLAFLFRGK